MVRCVPLYITVGTPCLYLHRVTVHRAATASCVPCGGVYRFLITTVFSQSGCSRKSSLRSSGFGNSVSHGTCTPRSQVLCTGLIPFLDRLGNLDLRYLPYTGLKSFLVTPQHTTVLLFIIFWCYVMCSPQPICRGGPINGLYTFFTLHRTHLFLVCTKKQKMHKPDL